MSRWVRCVQHRGDRFDPFVRDFLAQPGRSLLLVAAAGFDIRSTLVAQRLCQFEFESKRALLIREERSGKPSDETRFAKLSRNSEKVLAGLFPNHHTLHLGVFDPIDRAVVVGSRTVQELTAHSNLTGVTDIVVDVTSLSIGVSFPLVRFMLGRVETLRREGERINLHVMMAVDPRSDDAIGHEYMDKMSIVKGFEGNLRLSSDQDHTTRLWIPQLALRRRVALQRMFQALVEMAPLLDVCPLLPFPCGRPRRADELLVEFRDELEERWAVDERNLLYAAEGDPLDVYRVVARLVKERQQVFQAIGSSEIVLSPVGHRATALGCMMAAIEFNLPVIYVETVRYTLPAGVVQAGGIPEFLHVWLCGDAYTRDLVDLE